jgi:hypothetical protein
MRFLPFESKRFSPPALAARRAELARARALTGRQPKAGGLRPPPDPGIMKIFAWDSPKPRPGHCETPPLTETPTDLPFRGPPEDEPPPVMGSWRRLYTAVLIHLAFWIAVFYAFTVEFDITR